MPVVLLRTDFNFLLFCKLTMTTDLSFFRCQDRLCHSDDAFWKKWGKTPVFEHKNGGESGI